MGVGAGVGTGVAAGVGSGAGVTAGVSTAGGWLSAGAEAAYRAALSDHGEVAVTLLLDRRDTEGLSFLLSQKLLSPAQRAAACDAARQRGNTEALALLLEDLRPAPGQGLDKSFDL